MSDTVKHAHRARPFPFRRVHAILLVFLLFLPFLQRTTRLFPRVRLYGAEARPKRPELTLQTWFDGSYAAASEGYFTHKIGFRGLLVRLVNQIHYSVFGHVTDSQGTAVMMGQDGWLYESEYVRHYVRRPGLRQESCDWFVGHLKALQDELDALGIVFAVVISPSKPEIIPEHLPEQVVAQRRSKGPPNAYELLRPQLNAAGVRVVDGHAYFQQLHREQDHIFPRGGTHWSYYGSFLFCQHLLGELQRLLPGRIVVPDLAGITFLPARGTDNDLALMLNLLSRGPSAEKLPYPEVAVSNALPMERRVGVLVVGDSFSFTLLDSLNTARAVGKMDLLYYHKRHFDYPAEDLAGCMMTHADYDKGGIDRGAIDWEPLLLSKQVVLLEINEILLNKRGWGFVEDALAFLRSR